MFDPQRRHIYSAKITTKKYSCFIRVETYWSNTRLSDRTAWFFATESNFPTYNGHPEDFKTKLLRDNECQAQIPKEYMKNTLAWIERRLKEAYGANCKIETTFKGNY